MDTRIKMWIDLLKFGAGLCGSVGEIADWSEVLRIEYGHDGYWEGLGLVWMKRNQLHYVLLFRRPSGCYYFHTNNTYI